MDVFDMPCEVLLVTNHMLPIAALPDPAFPLRRTAWRTELGRRNLPRKAVLDEHPASGEVRVAGRQRPQGVQVIGENDHGVDAEGMRLAHPSRRFAQGIDVVDEQARLTVGEVDREEVRRPGDVSPTIAHGGMIVDRLGVGVRGLTPTYG